ncbi:MAG: protein kinase [Vicinamibacteria bacterium]|nr:protein kinase [Vicinamibacteria bacterium]
MTLAPGSRLGPYEIVSSLGAGGMGEVFRAKDARLGREVAIKVLPRELASDPDRLARFEREAKAVAALSHPNILAIHDFGTEGDTTFAVLELIEGETLRAKLKAAALPLRKAMDYGAQLANGLAAAHDKDIVHRDLKPENIMVTPDGRIKVLDFGLARTAVEGDVAEGATKTHATEAGMVMGTLGYMSPEQAKGKHADRRSDVFALGCVLYEMVTGKRAFPGDSQAESLSAILRDDPPAMSLSGRQVPAVLESVVSRCLEKDPDQRFQSARDLAFTLQNVTLEGSAVSGFITPTRKFRWSSLRPVAAVAALIAVAVAAGMFAGQRRGATPVVRQITFDRGTVRAARFTADMTAIVYSATWGGRPMRTFMTRIDSENRESTDLGLPDAGLLSISEKGQMALAVDQKYEAWLADGRLAEVELLGKNPRPLLDSVREADWIPGSTEMAVVRRVEGRDRVEFPLGKVVYESKGYVSHARVSPQGDRVAFLDHARYGDNRGRVTVATKDGKVTPIGEEWISSEGLDWSADGKEIWFTAVMPGEPSSLRAFPAGGGEPRLVWQTPQHLVLMDVAKDGRVLLASGSITSFIASKAPDESRERDLAWLGWSDLFDISGDGKTLLVTGFELSDEYTAFARGTDGTPALKLGGGLSLALSADGTQALSMSAKDPTRLSILSVGAGEPRSLSGPPGIENALFTPDGLAILIQVRDADRRSVHRIDARSGAIERLFEVDGPVITSRRGAPWAISPDGSRLAVQDLDGAVRAWPLSAGKPQPLLKLGANEKLLRWDSEASVLVGAVDRRAGYVDRVKLAGNTRSRLHAIEMLDEAGVLFDPFLTVSQDGRAYAYSSSRFLNSLYLVNGLK